MLLVPSVTRAGANLGNSIRSSVPRLVHSSAREARAITRPTRLTGRANGSGLKSACKRHFWPSTPSRTTWNRNAYWTPMSSSSRTAARMMNRSLTNSTVNLAKEPMPTETASRPHRVFADWRISLLVLVGLWLVIYVAGLSRSALLDDADTVHAEAARE